ELIEPLELRLADLDRVEQPAGTVVAEADRLREPVELPVEPVETVEGGQLAGIHPAAGMVAQQPLQPSQLGGQVLAQGAVDVAPQLAVLETAVTGDRRAQPFQPVTLSPSLFKSVGHSMPPDSGVPFHPIAVEPLTPPTPSLPARHPARR